MNVRYTIQGRVIERNGRQIIRDEVRIDESDSYSGAVRSAENLAGEGFTVWIFTAKPGPHTAPTYHLIRTLRPGDPEPQRAVARPQPATVRGAA